MSSYDFINAKVHGMRGKLYENERLLELLEAHTLDDILNELYPDFKGEYLNHLLVEKQLVTNYIEGLFGIVRKLGEREAEFFNIFVERIYIENIKIILKFWHSQAEPEDLDNYLIEISGYPPLPTKRLLECNSIYEFVEKLPRSLEDYKPYIRQKTDSYKKYKKTFYIEIAIDTCYFERLWNKLKVLNSHDRKIMREIIGTELDINILSWIFRYKNSYKLDWEDAKTLLYAKPYKLTYQDIQKIYASESLADMIKALPGVYRKSFQKIPIDLNQFEAVLWNYLYRFANRQFYASAFDISVIGGFYVVKKIEMMNLIRIIEARRYGMPREQIRALLIPPL